MHSPRRQGRARTRILYWHRTPPGIRVGRAALDEDAITLIEQHHPHIRFDWPQILKGEGESPATAGTSSPNRDATPPAVDAVSPLDSAADAPLSAAQARLGSDGLARLRARYANVMSAIAQRVTDSDRQEQLRSEAERLNPDSWVTAEEVQLGLDQYEMVFESLRGVVGRTRRRRKSSESAADTAGAAGEGAEDSTGPAVETDNRSEPSEPTSHN